MTDGVLGGRQATTVLTRATWTAGTIFMVLALVLSIMSSRADNPTSIIDIDQPVQPQGQPEPVLPGTGTEPPVIPEGSGSPDGGGSPDQPEP